MRPLTMISYVCLSTFLVSCAGGSSESPSRRGVNKKPSSDDQQTESNSGGSDDGSSSNEGAPLDCGPMWALAVKQQPVGAKFVYSSNFAASSITKQFDRVETITASSDQSITRNITIDDSLIKQFASGLASQPVTLTKEHFLSVCQKSAGQPVAVAGLGGEVTVKGQADDKVTIGSQQIKVKRVNMQVTNVKYGSYTISGDVVVYISPSYPGLPLKQTLTVSDSSMALLKGAVIEDQIKSGLPSVR